MPKPSEDESFAPSDGKRYPRSDKQAVKPSELDKPELRSFWKFKPRTLVFPFGRLAQLGSLVEGFRVVPVNP